jgi:GntR family transcriptional repressor for pyruvate dehydrogenase complex
MEIENKLEKIKLKKPEDIILDQIKKLISSGELNPGEKLPPERTLAEKFGVGRGYVRSAIKKLEFYGIVKIHPQSGTIVSETGVTIIEGLLSNIIELEKPDYDSLLESRKIIELQTVKMAAERCNAENAARLTEAFEKYREKLNAGEDAIEEDILFHIRIAEAAKNQVLRSIIMIISQDIIRLSRENNSCKGDRKFDAANEHLEILTAILERNPGKAFMAMQIHLNNT